jgi:predicted membrane protein
MKTNIKYFIQYISKFKKDRLSLIEFLFMSCLLIIIWKYIHITEIIDIRRHGEKERKREKRKENSVLEWERGEGERERNRKIENRDGGGGERER